MWNKCEEFLNISKKANYNIHRELYMRKKSGFTLVELLVVVAVIGVLVGILIPIFSSRLEKAKRSVDINNARTMRSALASAINNGELQILTDDTTIVLHVSRTKVDGGVCDGKFSNVLINGAKYKGNADLWDLMNKYGVSKDVRMKQTDDSIDWYCISFNGNGESFYYEGKGVMNDFRDPNVATKYEWTQLSDK